MAKPSQSEPELTRVDELRQWCREHPRDRAVDIAKVWGVTPQAIRELAKRSGVLLAGSPREFSEVFGGGPVEADDPII